MRICETCFRRLTDGNRYEVEIFPENPADPPCEGRTVDLCEICRAEWFAELARNRPKGALILNV